MKPVQKTTFLENHKLNRDIQMLERQPYYYTNRNSHHFHLRLW